MTHKKRVPSIPILLKFRVQGSEYKGAGFSVADSTFKDSEFRV